MLVAFVALVFGVTLVKMGENRTAARAGAPMGNRRLSPAPDAGRRAAARTALLCVAVLFGMTGAAFAAVPLYRAFCQATGFGGTGSPGGRRRPPRRSTGPSRSASTPIRGTCPGPSRCRRSARR
jgi:hypothetical protein